MKVSKIYFLLFVLSLATQVFAEQAIDYQAMVLDLQAKSEEKLANFSQEKKDEYKQLAQDLASKAKISNQEKKELLELNEKSIKKIESTNFVSDDKSLAESGSRFDLENKQIYIFVSSSMKKPNLIRLGKEAAERGASLVMRGFIENSYLKTAAFLKEVIEKTGQGISIDPSLFEAYGVTEVPTFVVADGNKYDKLSGNISLDYAIREVQNKGEVFNKTKENNENN